MKGFALSLALLLASGCATTSSTHSHSQWVLPAQAVQLAAPAAPRGVPGVFAILVQGTGTQHNHEYLNSEPDYRDQRNLTIEITPAAARQLQARFGAPPIVALKGKRILVTGVAYRTTIFFFANGKRTDKYYYQTHVRVTDA